MNDDGYILIAIPAGHHRVRGAYPYMLEHRLVMERKLRRELLQDETVHHINGIRHDNRLENLELMTRHPPGQRVADLLPWAKDLIMRYDPSWHSADSG